MPAKTWEDPAVKNTFFARLLNTSKFKKGIVDVAALPERSSVSGRSSSIAADPIRDEEDYLAKNQREKSVNFLKHFAYVSPYSEDSRGAAAVVATGGHHPRLPSLSTTGTRHSHEHVESGSLSARGLTPSISSPREDDSPFKRGFTTGVLDAHSAHSASHSSGPASPSAAVRSRLGGASEAHPANQSGTSSTSGLGADHDHDHDHNHEEERLSRGKSSMMMGGRSQATIRRRSLLGLGPDGNIINGAPLDDLGEDILNMPQDSGYGRPAAGDEGGAGGESDEEDDDEDETEETEGTEGGGSSSVSRQLSAVAGSSRDLASSHRASASVVFKDRGMRQSGQGMDDGMLATTSLSAPGPSRSGATTPTPHPPASGRRSVSPQSPLRAAMAAGAPNSPSARLGTASGLRRGLSTANGLNPASSENSPDLSPNAQAGEFGQQPDVGSGARTKSQFLINMALAPSSMRPDSRQWSSTMAASMKDRDAANAGRGGSPMRLGTALTGRRAPNVLVVNAAGGADSSSNSSPLPLPSSISPTSGPGSTTISPQAAASGALVLPPIGSPGLATRSVASMAQPPQTAGGAGGPAPPLGPVPPTRAGLASRVGPAASMSAGQLNVAPGQRLGTALGHGRGQVQGDAAGGGGGGGGGVTVQADGSTVHAMTGAQVWSSQQEPPASGPAQAPVLLDELSRLRVEDQKRKQQAIEAVRTHKVEVGPKLYMEEEVRWSAQPKVGVEYRKRYVNKELGRQPAPVMSELSKPAFKSWKETKYGIKGGAPVLE